MGSPWDIHGLDIDSLQDTRVLPMSCPRASHGIMLVRCPWVTHGLRTGFPRATHGITMGYPWVCDTYGYRTEYPWIADGPPAGHPWDLHGMTMGWP